MKKVLLLTIVTFTFLLTGCGSKTSFNEDDSVEPYTQIYATNSGENKNIDSWQTYYIKELGFSIKLPFQLGQIHPFDEFIYTYIACDKLSCGEKQYGMLGDLKQKYKALGSVSKDYNSGESWQLHEVYDVSMSKDMLTIFGPQKKKIEVQILKKIKNQAQNVEFAIVPVSNPQKITSKEAFSGEKGYAAFFKLPNQNKSFKAAVLYFSTEDLSLESFEKALQTITLDRNPS